MRPLMYEAITASIDQDKTDNKKRSGGSEFFEAKLKKLRDIYHSECLFNRQTPVVPGLIFSFDDKGAMHGRFICNSFQQGYNEMVHGGVIAGLIDASMAQCLMGHGVICYTAELSIRYCKPVKIRIEAELKTFIAAVNVEKLYTMKCEIVQNHSVVVKATGKFIKVIEAED